MPHIFQIYIKIKTEITDIDIAEGYQRTDNQKLKLILLILISLKDIKEQIIKIKIDIAEGYQRTDNQKLKLILLILISLKNIKEQIIKIKTDITEIDIAES